MTTGGVLRKSFAAALAAVFVVSSLVMGAGAASAETIAPPAAVDASDGTTPDNDEARATEPVEAADEPTFEGQPTASTAAQNPTVPAPKLGAASNVLAQTASIDVTVEEVTNSKIIIKATGQGFNDVTPVGIPPSQHVYLGLIEKNTDLGTITQETEMPTVAVDIKEDGTFDETDFWSAFEESAGNLDQGKEYEVISWPARSNPTLENLYTRADLTIDWEALFPAGAVSGTAAVASATTAGLTIKAELTNLQPADYPSGIRMGVVLRGTSDRATSFVGGESTIVTIPDSGIVETNIVIPRDALDRHAQYEVVAWPADAEGPQSSNIIRTMAFNVSQTEWEAVFPAPPPATSTPAAGALIWGVSDGFRGYTIGRIAKGDMRTSGVGGGPGGYLYPQASSDGWNRATNTGTVNYSGTVTFWGHGGLMSESFSNPSITITSPISGSLSVAGRGTFSLSLLSGSMTTNADGSVTWRNVPVNGEICGGGASGGSSGGGCFGLDPVTFTVGSVSNVNFGSTVSGNSTKEKRTPAATPPATTGITMITDPAKIQAGGRIEFQASGFDPNDEGVLVVLYSEPILLDDSAKADANGVVTWRGTLPEDVVGVHTITLQGSTNAGAIIEILEPAKKVTPRAVAATAETGGVQTAGPALVSNGGMQVWEWWAGAAGLVLIAACTTALAIRQRKLSA